MDRISFVGLNQWNCSSKVVENFVTLTSVIKAPKDDDPLLPTWDSENSTIMSWLVKELGIGRIYLILLTIKDLWDAMS